MPLHSLLLFLLPPCTPLPTWPWPASCLLSSGLPSWSNGSGLSLKSRVYSPVGKASQRPSMASTKPSHQQPPNQTKDSPALEAATASPPPALFPPAWGHCCPGGSHPFSALLRCPAEFCNAQELEPVVPGLIPDPTFPTPGAGSRRGPMADAHPVAVPWGHVAVSPVSLPSAPELWWATGHPSPYFPANMDIKINLNELNTRLWRIVLGTCQE